MAWAPALSAWRRKSLPAASQIWSPAPVPGLPWKDSAEKPRLTASRPSLLASLRRWRCCGFGHCQCSVLRRKNLGGHPPDICFAHLVHPIHLAKQLAPIAVARLDGAQVLRQPFVIGQAADQICADPPFHPLRLFIPAILLYQLVDFLVHRGANFLRRVPAAGHHEKG